MQKEKGVSKSDLSVAGMGIQCSLSCVYQRRSTTPFILVHEHAHIHIYVLSVPYHCCCRSLQAFANNWYSGTDNYTKMCRPSPPCRQGPCSTTWPSPQGYYPDCQAEVVLTTTHCTSQVRPSGCTSVELQSSKWPSWTSRYIWLPGRLPRTVA